MTNALESLIQDHSIDAECPMTTSRNWIARTPWNLTVGVLAFLAGTGTIAAQDAPASGETLEVVSAEMAVVVRDLSKQNTGAKTQDRQKEIVTRLDALIELLEQQQRQGRGGGASSANPTSPLPDSMVIGGPGGVGDLHAPKDGGSKWGQLPPHERDKILQSMTEGFPSHYREVLERYYRRLAEEQPVANTPAEPKPAPTATLAPAPKPPTPSAPVGPQR